MAPHNKTLIMIATKLGLGEDDKLVSKAAEFERLLETKTIAGSNLTDTSKIVICLDLAASLFGADLDTKTTIKYSGLKSATYTNNRKIIQNLLQLNEDKLTTLVLCNTLQCSGVQQIADKIIMEYKKQAKMEVDLNLPQYVCMAVYQACRIGKVKITKSKIIEKSRLKPAQWAKLEADWTKFVDENFAANRKRGRQAKNGATSDAEDKMEIDVVAKTEEPVESQMEPYQNWKKRVLDAAYKDVKKLKEETKVPLVLSPRRSPRKTPQKTSPVKSPAKAAPKGVRLLFPLKLM